MERTISGTCSASTGEEGRCDFGIWWSHRCMVSGEWNGVKWRVMRVNEEEKKVTKKTSSLTGTKEDRQLAYMARR